MFACFIYIYMCVCVCVCVCFHIIPYVINSVGRTVLYVWIEYCI